MDVDLRKQLIKGTPVEVLADYRWVLVNGELKRDYSHLKDKADVPQLHEK